jgi:hypothetical protein
LRLGGCSLWKFVNKQFGKQIKGRTWYPKLGNSVDISGNFAVAGTDHDGRFYVYKKNDMGSWDINFEKNITGSEYKYQDITVSIHGNRLIVGSNNYPKSGLNGSPGRINIYEYSGGSWNFIKSFQGSPWNGGNPRDSSGLGASVAISGNIAAATTWKNEIQFFEKISGTWKKTKVISASGDASYSYGDIKRLAIEGNTVVIGQNNFTDVYEKISNMWIRVSRLMDSSSWPHIVDIKGDLIASGQSKSVNVYRKIKGIWQKEKTITNNDSNIESLDVSKDSIALLYRYPKTFVKIWKKFGNVWGVQDLGVNDPVGGIIKGSLVPRDISMDGDNIVIGNVGDDSLTVTNSGSVSFYEK